MLLPSEERGQLGGVGVSSSWVGEEIGRQLSLECMGNRRVQRRGDVQVGMKSAGM